MSAPHIILVICYGVLFAVNLRNLFTGEQITQPNPRVSALVGMSLSAATLGLLFLGYKV